MIQRKALAKLRLWKASHDRKPLILRGARQVGKTTLVREFGKEFANFVEVNLERQQEAKLFELDTTELILNSIFLQKNVYLKKGSTLLFIDEIQESPRAIAQLRYFKYLIPLEVKSGSTGSLRSLHQFMDRCGHPYAVRFYAGHFKVEQTQTVKVTPFTLLNLPYYLGTQLVNFLNNYVV